jgi:hypothetical protein
MASSILAPVLPMPKKWMQWGDWEPEALWYSNFDSNEVQCTLKLEEKIQ